jgi:hypothetical protein
MKKLMGQMLVTLFAAALCYLPGLLTGHTLDADLADLSGKWVGYYADGGKSEYVWCRTTSGRSNKPVGR